MNVADSLVIRPATGTDLKKIIEIEQICFSNHPWDETTLSHYDCLVACVDGITVGFLIYRELFPASGETGGEVEILNLAVHPDHRRRGIGRALLSHQLARGGRHFLEVRESNLAARKLYESMDFTEIGKRRWYYDNPRETAIVMQRK